MTEDEKKALLEWELILKNICDFVQVGRVNGIRFEVYTNEQGHNRPHLHVSTSDAAMSIAKSVKHIKPIKSVRKIKRIKAIKQLGWSNLKGVLFFQQ